MYSMQGILLDYIAKGNLPACKWLQLKIYILTKQGNVHTDDSCIHFKETTT